MDEEIERLVIAVRADTGGFARDVDAMKGQLDGPLGDAASRAGHVLEAGLTRAIRTGKLGFDDLKAVALSVLGEIAAAVVRGGIASLLGGGGGRQGGGEGGLLAAAGALIAGASGRPGRATGGPVSPGAAYLVGERGPELFVPTASGAVAPIAAGAPPRDVRLQITVAGPAGAAPELLARSSRQVARAVRDELLALEG